MGNSSKKIACANAANVVGTCDHCKKVIEGVDTVIHSHRVDGGRKIEQLCRNCDTKQHVGDCPDPDKYHTKFSRDENGFLICATWVPIWEEKMCRDCGNTTQIRSWAKLCSKCWHRQKVRDNLVKRGVTLDSLDEMSMSNLRSLAADVNAKHTDIHSRLEYANRLKSYLVDAHAAVLYAPEMISDDPLGKNN